MAQKKVQFNLKNDVDLLLPEDSTVLPVQYFVGNVSWENWTGERRLIYAILEEAILSFQTHAFAHTRRGQRLFREASDWIMSNDDAPFSCAWICQHIGIDETYLQKQLARWLERRRHPIIPPAIEELATLHS